MKNMKKTLKKYFIPHPENEHKPHFLREKSVITTAFVAVVLFLASMFGNHVVMTTPQLASIKSAFLVDLTNKDRVKEGLPELSINTNLVTAASMKALDMADKEYFAHQSPDGRMPWDFIRAAGYSYVFAGENLAVNFDDSSEVQQAWMDSPTHKKNIVNPKYTEIGIATAPGRYKGDNTMYVVQMFGRPRSTVLPVAEASTSSPVVLAEVSTSEEPDNVLGEETQAEPSQTVIKDIKDVKDIETVEIAMASSASPIIAEPQPISEPIVESSMEFTDPEATPTELADINTATQTEVPAYTNWFERLIVSPSAVVQDLYMVLFAIVVFSLILKIFIEIRLQHPKNIAYGLLLLIVIFGFMQMNTNLVGKTQVALQTVSS